LAVIPAAGTLRPVVAQAVAAIALGLLGASGVVKLIDPDPTTGAMSTAGLPSSHTLSRSLGLGEIATAVVGLSVGGVALFVGAGLYAAFAGFTATALYQRLPIQSCGCFGRDDTPPTRLHLGYNVVAGAALVAVAVPGVAPIDWSFPPVELVLYLGFAAIGVYASYLLMARLPQLLELARNP
jgi:hypothetical protein